MSMELSPPYWAWRSGTPSWCVVNAKGGLEMECDCRRHAEEIATEMNELAGITPARAAAMHAQISRNAGPNWIFDPPGDELQSEPESKP